MRGMKRNKYTYTWDPYPYLPLDTHSYYHRLRSIIQNLQEVIDDHMDDREVNFALRMLQDAYIPATMFYNGISSDVGVHRSITITMEQCSDKALDEMGFSLNPCFEKVIFEGNLPNSVTLMFHCNFWKNNNNTNNSNKKKLKKCMASELIYIHGKTIPWRCQVRALRTTATRDVFNRYPKIYEMLIKVWACSLLGNYKHCNNYPPFQQRCLIYDWFIFRPVNRDDVISWLCKEENQRVLENVWREYILFIVSLIPSLRHGIVDRYMWDKIEKNTVYAMDDLRHHIGNLYHQSNKSHCSNMWFSTMKELLTENDAFKRLEPKVFVPTPKLFVAKMIDEISKLEHAYSSESDEFKKPYFSRTEDVMMMNLILNYTGDADIPLFLLTKINPESLEHIYETDDGQKGICNPFWNPFETTDTVIENLCRLIVAFYSRRATKDIRNFLFNLKIYTYQKIKSFFIHLHRKQSVVIHTLPIHQYRAQLLALCKKHQKSTPAELSEYAGVYYYSHTCGFKGSLVPSIDDDTKEENLDAWGNKGVSCSADGNQIRCYHKKSTRKRRKSSGKKQMFLCNHFDNDDSSETLEPIIDKEKKTTPKFEKCDGSVLEINLTGRLLECPEGVITLCCYCANPAKYDVDRFRDGLFVCTRCPRDDAKPTGECFLCREFTVGKKKTNGLREIKVLDDIDSILRAIRVSICSRCYKNSSITPDLLPHLSELKEKRRKYDENRITSKIERPSTFVSKKDYKGNTIKTIKTRRSALNKMTIATVHIDNDVNNVK